MTTTKQKNARRLKKRDKVGQGSSLISFHKFLSQNSNLTPNYVAGVTVLTAEEVAKHSSPSDMWTIYRGNVYNIGPFLDYHPGGEEELLKASGRDCTAMYDEIHPWVNIDAVMGSLKLGPLRGNTPASSPAKAAPKQISTPPTPIRNIAFDLPPAKAEARSVHGPSSGVCSAENTRPIRVRDVLNFHVRIFQMFLAVTRA